MNRDDIEKRLRTPHPLERSYGEYRLRGPRRPVVRHAFVGGLGLSWVLLLLIAAGLVVGIRLVSSNGVGALPQPSNPASIASPEPTKPIVSRPPVSPSPPLTLAACAPGSVFASLSGWGGAMGIEYASIRLATLGGPCSLPLDPAVTLEDGAGSILATSDSAAGNGRIALVSPLMARVGVASLCSSSLSPAIVMVLDLGNSNVVRLPMPAKFTQACQGASSRISVDDLFAAP